MITRRALLTAVLSLVPVAASAADVWVAGATEKIRPDAAPRGSREAVLGAARNEFEAFQVVVTGPARNVTAHAGSLGGPGTLSDVKLYRVDTITLSSPSSADGGTGRWPDALVPDVDDVVGEKRNAFPFDVAAGESRAIWVEFRVPPDAAPGSYRGEVAISFDGGSAAVPVSLEVWDFVLPSTSSLRTHFGLGYGYLEAGHGVGGDDASTMRVRYAQLGLDHRISLSGIFDDGKQGNWDHFDRFYAPLLAGTAPTRLPGARLTTAKYIGDPTSVDVQRQWADYAKRNGWFDRLFQYTCDEPPLTCRWDEIPARTGAAHAADPNFRTLVTTQVWDADEHGVSGGIDIMVPVVNFIDDKPGSPISGSQRSRYDGFLSSGANKELWLYESCMSHGCGGTVNIGSPSDEDRYFTGWPTYMIDASAVRNRAMEWISFIERATGELYWETTFAFTHDAWSNQWDFSGNGDGTLFYPGTPARIGGQTHIPVASIRLKMVREGMEDFEYLKLLEAAGEGDQARQIARTLFPSAYQTEASPEALMAARQQIAYAILLKSGKELPSGTQGCGSGGGFGGGALLALPLLLAAAFLRRFAKRR